jgi:hypothetical protein
MAPPDEMSLGELSRRLADVFLRLEGMAQRLEGGAYVRTDLYAVNQLSNERQMKALETQIAALEKDKAERDALGPIEARVVQLEDDRKWLIRLVLAFVVMAVLGTIFVASGGTAK